MSTFKTRIAPASAEITFKDGAIVCEVRKDCVEFFSMTFSPEQYAELQEEIKHCQELLKKTYFRDLKPGTLFQGGPFRVVKVPEFVWQGLIVNAIMEKDALEFYNYPADTEVVLL